MILVRLPTAELPHRKPSLDRLISWSTATLLTVTAGLIILLAILILLHQNYNATKGYRLRTLERGRTQLLLSLEQINTMIAEVQSLTSLQRDTQILGMVKVTKPQYLRGETVVAQQEWKEGN